MPSRKILRYTLGLATMLAAPMLDLHPAAAQYQTYGVPSGYGSQQSIYGGPQSGFGGQQSIYGGQQPGYGYQQPNGYGLQPGYGNGANYGNMQGRGGQQGPQAGAPVATWPQEDHQSTEQTGAAAGQATGATPGAAGAPAAPAAAVPQSNQASEADNGPAIGSKLQGSAVAERGDMLTIGGALVQLRGLQAPEVGSICGSGGTTWDCGQRGRDFLQKLLARGRVVCTVVSGGNPAQATCKLGRDDIGSAVVDAGMAQSSDPELSGHQFAAQLDGRGLWWNSPGEATARVRATRMRSRGQSIEGVTGN